MKDRTEVEKTDKLKELQEELSKEIREREKKCSDLINKTLAEYNCDIKVEMICVEDKGIVFRKSIVSK